MRVFFIIVIVVFIIGCVANPTYIRPPMNSKITNNSIEIKKDYDAVWTSLIEYSSKSFFSIKNIEKESGLLTLNFGSGEPEKFVNCGIINSPGIRYKGSYIGAIERTGYVDLNGVMNIFVKPITNNSTSITVNTRYIVSAKDGGLPKQTWTFDTNGEQTRRTGIVNVTCKPTLKAENNIINGIVNISKISTQ